jgi:hypothetical protein
VEANKALLPLGPICKGVHLLQEEGKGGKYKKSIDPSNNLPPPPTKTLPKKISLQILYSPNPQVASTNEETFNWEK